MIKLLQQKQAESKTKVCVAVNYVSIKPKQLKNIKISTFIFVRVGSYFDDKYAISSQSVLAIIKTCSEYKAKGYQREACHITSIMMHTKSTSTGQTPC